MELGVHPGQLLTLLLVPCHVTGGHADLAPPGVAVLVESSRVKHVTNTLHYEKARELAHDPLDVSLQSLPHGRVIGERQLQVLEMNSSVK